MTEKQFEEFIDSCDELLDEDFDLWGELFHRRLYRKGENTFIAAHQNLENPTFEINPFSHKRFKLYSPKVGLFYDPKVD